MADLDEGTVQFLRGVLAMAAATRQVLDYEHVRRLCGLSKQQIGSYLGAARQVLAKDEPDFCAIVVNTSGEPGAGFGNADNWARQLRRVHDYWHYRMLENNDEFIARFGRKPSVP
jgi:hypothetical protein